MGSTNKPDAVDLECLIGGGIALALVDHQAVLETGAPAALDEDPQAGADPVLLGQQFGNLLGGRFSHVDHVVIIPGSA